MRFLFEQPTSSTPTVSKIGSRLLRKAKHANWENSVARRSSELPSGSGMACRDAQGWKLEALGEGAAGARTEYRMAGADAGAIMARAQSMADGPALDAEAEAEARATGWQ